MSADELRLAHKKIIYSLTQEPAEPHIGEYFQVIYFNQKYHLYYNSSNRIKLVISNDLSFLDKPSSVIIQNAPGGSFCIIAIENKLKMLCGAHVSNKEENEIVIPDLVSPENVRYDVSGLCLFIIHIQG